MKYFIIVEELKASPGLYGTKHTLEEIRQKYDEFKDIENGEWINRLLGFIMMIPFIPWIFINSIFSKEEKIRNLTPEFKKNKTFILEDSSSTVNNKVNSQIFTNCINIPELFLNFYSDFDNRIFQGAFKTSKHLSTLLPKQSGNELIIMPLNNAQKFFNQENINFGLFISNENYSDLFPLLKFKLVDKMDVKHDTSPFKF
jgi:hypothetical protein